MVDYTRCAFHDRHETRRVVRNLSDHILADAPKIPPKFDRQLAMTIYAWEQYSDDTFSMFDYCPGQDVVSYCIDRQGLWEPYETLAVLDILQTPGLVVDVGSHIGWYMTLAASLGCDTHGVEAYPESANLALDNAANQHPDTVVAMSCVLVEKAKPVEAQPVRLFISDVEGSEVAAVDYCRPSFEAGLVDYALLEMSPVFNDTYPQLTQQLLDWGYVGYMIPHKGEHLETYGLEPLRVLLATEPVTPQIVAGWRQESAVFVRNDLV